MDTDELKKIVAIEFATRLSETATRSDRVNFEAPINWASRILEEREAQRKRVFDLAIHTSHAVLGFLIAIIALQAVYRIVTGNPNFSFFSGHELEVFSVGVFSQIIGLVYMIAKRLWDDSTYKKHLGRKTNQNQEQIRFSRYPS
ncbi:MAG: hypothetical protein WAP52_01970 [Candidatus Sungiibacteriota bacterium]